MNNPYLYLYRTEGVEDEPRSVFSLRSCRESLVASGGEYQADCVILGTDLSNLLLAYQATLGGLRVIILGDGEAPPRVPWRIPLCRLASTGSAALQIPSALLAAIRMSRMRNLISRRSKGPRRALNALGSVLSYSQELVRSASQTEGVVELSLDFNEDDLARDLLLAARREGGVFLGDVRILSVEPESVGGTYLCEVREARGVAGCRIRCGGIVTAGELATIPFSRLRPPVAGESARHDVLRVVCQVRTVADAEPLALIDDRYLRMTTSDQRVALLKVLDPTRVQVDLLRGSTDDICDTQELMPIVAEVVERAGTPRKKMELEEIISARWAESGIATGGGIVQRGGVVSAPVVAPWDAMRVAQRVALLLEQGTLRFPPLTEVLQRPRASATFGSEYDEFRSAAQDAGIPNETVERAWRRWRGRVRELSAVPEGLREIGPGILAGEIDLAFRSEHYEKLSAIAFDVLHIHEYRGWEDLLHPIARKLGEVRGWEVSEEEIAAAARECQGSA